MWLGRRQRRARQSPLHLRAIALVALLFLESYFGRAAGRGCWTCSEGATNCGQVPWLPSKTWRMARDWRQLRSRKASPRRRGFFFGRGLAKFAPILDPMERDGTGRTELDRGIERRKSLKTRIFRYSAGAVGIARCELQNRCFEIPWRLSATVRFGGNWAESHPNSSKAGDDLIAAPSTGRVG
jgi:hypothetical protein